MNFVYDGNSCKATSKNYSCYIFTILSIFGICWSLLLDCASIELICHKKKCFLTQTSLAHRHGFFGTLRGSFQVLFPNGKSRQHFHVDQFQRTLVKEVVVSRKGGRRKTRYDVYLVMDGLYKLNSSGEEQEHKSSGGGEEIFWNRYLNAAAAEYDAVIIEGSMLRHREADYHSSYSLQGDDNRKAYDKGDRSSSSSSSSPERIKTPPAAHASVDNVSWDELFLALSLVVLYYSIAVCPHSEIIVINQECGIVVVERRTILSSKWQNLLSTTRSGIRPSKGGNVLLLAPVSLVAGVETTRHERYSRRRGTIVSWGLQMRMHNHYRNNGSSSSQQNIFQLRCGLTISDQRENDEDASRLRAALRLARNNVGDGSSSNNMDAAVGLRRVAAFQAENSDVEIGQQQRVGNGGGRICGGGDPGGQCAICLEKKARVAFAPCAHVCCCENCGQDRALVTCPICRSPIAHRIGLYFST